MEYLPNDTTLLANHGAIFHFASDGFVWMLDNNYDIRHTWSDVCLGTDHYLSLNNLESTGHVVT